MNTMLRRLLEYFLFAGTMFFADVTEAVEQDQIADSLLGDQPSTETTTDNATAGTETEVATEEVESQAEPELETTEEESAEDWLPTEQDRTFSDEALLRYA